VQGFKKIKALGVSEVLKSSRSIRRTNSSLRCIEHGFQSVQMINIRVLSFE